jgi:hypothetical protein
LGLRLPPSDDSSSSSSSSSRAVAAVMHIHMLPRVVCVSCGGRQAAAVLCQCTGLTGSDMQSRRGEGRCRTQNGSIPHSTAQQRPSPTDRLHRSHQ